MLLNKHLWRHQLAGLADVRRCIAVDLLAHGDTDAHPGRDISVSANATMLLEVINALKIDQVDLIGNDTGGGIAQIFAANSPGRLRSLTLTNCDVHDNWPSNACRPFVEIAANGSLERTLVAMLTDKKIYRTLRALGPTYESAESLTEVQIETYIRPLIQSEKRINDLQRFIAASDNRHTVAIEEKLQKLNVPTLILWGADDTYFPMKWAFWLASTIPGAREPIEVPGAGIFLPDDRPEVFNQLLRNHMLDAKVLEPV